MLCLFVGRGVGSGLVVMIDEMSDDGLVTIVRGCVGGGV